MYLSLCETEEVHIFEISYGRRNTHMNGKGRRNTHMSPYSLSHHEL